MRLSLLFLAAISAGAQTVPHTPRGPAATPESLAWQRYAAQSQTALAEMNRATPPALPPLPAGVTDLAFAEFFGPIGDRGLEYSAKLRALAGQRIRLVGYMVRESERGAGIFRFAGWPVAVETSGLCTVDDTPPATVHVVDPAAVQPPAWRPGRLVLIGTLQLGPHAEADGRNSCLRLVLDPPATATPAAAPSRS